MNTKKIVMIVSAVALVGVILFFAKKSSVPTGNLFGRSGEKEFTVDASNFKFSLQEIRVKKGDTVKITLTNSQGFHDFKVDGFNAATMQIKAGETSSTEFVADKAGTFEYYCSVGSHRQMGMMGKLIVEE